MACLNSYDLYCKWDGKKKRYSLFFEPPKDATKPIATFIYGRGDTDFNIIKKNGGLEGKLLSFNPKMSVTAQFTKYRVYSFDKSGTKKIAHTISMEDYMGKQSDIKFGGIKADGLLKSKSAAVSGAGVTLKAFGEDIETIGCKTFANEADAKKFLEGHMKRMSKDFITGTATVNGNNIIRSRQVYKFEGLGAFFDGNYFITKVIHKFDKGGYSCNLAVRKVLRELM